LAPRLDGRGGDLAASFRRSFGIELRQSYARLAMVKVGRYAHTRQFKLAFSRYRSHAALIHASGAGHLPRIAEHGRDP
jgi:hypothetical protein